MQIRLILLFILAIVAFDKCLGQVDGIETIELNIDTLESLTRNGIVVRVNYKCIVEYKEEFNKKELVEFCNSEIRYLIRQELSRLEPSSVSTAKIEKEIRPVLDSVFRVNNIKLRTLSIGRL